MFNHDTIYFTINDFTIIGFASEDLEIQPDLDYAEELYELPWFQLITFTPESTETIIKLEAKKQLSKLVSTIKEYNSSVQSIHDKNQSLEEFINKLPDSSQLSFITSFTFKGYDSCVQLVQFLLSYIDSLETKKRIIDLSMNPYELLPTIERIIINNSN